MTNTINYEPIWSGILVERLRAGRGSAISGQRRGRGLEDFAEALVREFLEKARMIPAAPSSAPIITPPNVI
jgi:hypothetical protein